MAVSVVSFLFSRAAQPEAQGLSFLLSAGFLYHNLSPTGLQNYWGPRARLRPGVAFPTTSYQQLLWTPTQSGAPRAPSALRGFPYHISSLTPTVWLLVLTELYNSSTPTQSPTLEWHAWSSSSGNNCHAVHRSLSSGASVCSGTVQPSPCPILSAELICAISFGYWLLGCITSAIIGMACFPGPKVKIQQDNSSVCIQITCLTSRKVYRRQKFFFPKRTETMQ